MEFRVLGSIEAMEDGRRLPVAPGRQAALLALLLIETTPVSVPQLCQAARQRVHLAVTVEAVVPGTSGARRREDQRVLKNVVSAPGLRSPKRGWYRDE